MAKVKIQGNASGTGIFTVTAPNSSTDRTITLPDNTGELLTSAGATMTGDLILGDNVKLEIGSASGGDLQIYHDGSNSYIDDAGTGDLRIRGANDLLIQSSTGEDMIKCVKDAQVNLYYDDVKKLNTTSTGAAITGTLDVTTVDLGDWTITESSGVLYFATGGTNKMKLDASGNLTCVGDVTANGSM